MKKILFSALLLAGFSATAQVKVGDNPTTINSSALLEMESTSKGLLMSRMTTAQRTAIASPANGLQVFDTDTKSFWHFDATALPAPGKWVEGTNNSNAKWIDGTTAGDIKLVNPTGKENIKYSDNGYKEMDKIATEDYSYNAADSTIVSKPIDQDYDFYNRKYYRSTSLTSTKTYLGFQARSFQIDNNETRSNNYWGEVREISVAKDNTIATIPLIRGFQNNMFQFSNNNISQMQSLIGNNYLYGSGNATVVVGLNGGNSLNKSGGTTTFARALEVSNGVGATHKGNITEMTGAMIQTVLSSKNVMTIGTLYGVRVNSNIPTTFKGTVTTSYDFYANQPVGGIITNRYGLYIEGSNKRNYIQGNLSLGANTNGGEKLQVTGGAKFTGTISNISFSSNGVDLTFARNAANYITASDPAGYFVINTGGNVAGVNSAVVIHSNRNVRIGSSFTSPPVKLQVDGYIQVASSDTTGDASPVNGMIRYNSTTNKFQGYAAGAWVDLH